MDAATVQLIVALLPVASKLIFQVGDKLIELNTEHLNDPQQLVNALEDSHAKGFPKLQFVSTQAK